MKVFYLIIFLTLFSSELTGQILSEPIDEKYNFSVIDSLNSIISDTTKDAELFLIRSYHKGIVSDYEGAIKDINKVLELTPFDYKALASRGDYKRYLQDYDAALEDYKTTIEMDKEYVEVYYGRALLYIETNQFEKAKVDMDTIINHKPNNAFNYFKRAECNGYMGNLKEALEDYNSAIKLQSGFKEALYGRALLLYKIGDFNQSLKELDLLLKIDPVYEFTSIHLCKGYSRIQKRQHKLAIKEFDKVISYDSLNAKAYNNIGSAFFHMKQYDSAMKYMNKAISINPEYPQAHSKRSDVKHMLGDHKGAMVDANKAIALDSTNWSFYNGRAMLKIKLNNYLGAIEDISTAIKIEPRMIQLVKMRAEIYNEMDDYANYKKDMDLYFKLKYSSVLYDKN